MNEDKLAFLDGNPTPEPDAPEPVVETVEPVAAEPAAPAPTAEPPKEQYIPISAVLDEREKRQIAQRRVEELERWKSEQEAKAQKQPDFYEDPEKFLAQQQTMVQQALWNERLNTSEIFARQQHGAELVGAAAEAFKDAATKSPALAAEFRGQADPYGFVIAWHQRQTVMSEIGNDPKAWREKTAAEMRAQIRAEIEAELASTQQPEAPKPRPPASLATAPAAGRGGEPRSTGSAFDRAFTR